MGGEASGHEEHDLTGIPKEGDIIASKFTVEKILGVGGMGVVVAARHIHLGQRVAVKFLRPEAAKHKEAIGRFLREARSAVSLQSAHVVRVMDVGTLDTGLPYMVMEHLSGEDLSSVLDSRGPLNVGEAVDYVLQACEAIAEAHSMGIVHRDLKPANLFLTKKPDGSPLVKVLDFGISKAVEVAGLIDQNLTSTASIMGSPLYMSPEQLRSSKNVDSRTDLWALGVIVFELVARSLPFEDETMTGLCAKIVADSPTMLREKRPDVSPELEAVVMRCLEKDVARRYQTVGELALALKPYAGSMDGQMAADRAARIGAPFRPPQASAPFVPPASTSKPEIANPPSVSRPAVAAPTRAATGFAATEASWQTAGESRRSRTRIVALVSGAAAVVAMGVLGFMALRSRGPADASPIVAVPTPTIPESPVAAGAGAGSPTTVPSPVAAPVSAAPSTTASAAPSASATTKAGGRPLVANGKPLPSAVASAPAKPPTATPPTPPPSPPSTAGLLDDRK